MVDRWTSDQNIKFVELYKEQTNLWNCLDPNYKNRDLRKASLDHIRKELGLNDNIEVTKKIKNLRSTYNQEVLKIEKSKKNGSAAEDIYKPSIKWFPAMDYIMKIINLKEKETTINLELRHASPSGNELSEESSGTNNDGLGATRNSNNTIEIQPMKPPKRPRLKMKLPPEPSGILAAINELKELNKSLAMSAPSAITSEDECDVIGKHVALQLRQLPPIDRIDATDEIQAILSRYRKKALCTRYLYTPSDCSSESAPSPHQNWCGIPPLSPPTCYQSDETSVSAHTTQSQQTSQSTLAR